MRAVTIDEIQTSTDFVHDMTEDETREFMAGMQLEQPYIQVYVAAICERGDFEDENDADAFANLAGIVWHAMRQAAGGPFTVVEGRDLDDCEAKVMDLLRYAEGEAESDWPDTVRAWMDGYNQQPVMEFVLEALLSPENQYGVTEEGIGLIFTHLKVIIDCLDNAALQGAH